MNRSAISYETYFVVHNRWNVVVGSWAFQKTEQELATHISEERWMEREKKSSDKYEYKCTIVHTIITQTEVDRERGLPCP